MRSALIYTLQPKHLDDHKITAFFIQGTTSNPSVSLPVKTVSQHCDFLD